MWHMIVRSSQIVSVVERTCCCYDLAYGSTYIVAIAADRAVKYSTRTHIEVGFWFRFVAYATE